MTSRPTAFCRVCQAPIDAESLDTVDLPDAASGPICRVCRGLEAGAAPSRTLGPFQILGVLGKGAVGVVYEVFDPRRNERLALKTLSEEAGVTSVHRQRFLREAQILTRLAHPGIVGAVEVGSTGEVAWIAMPKVEGEDLESVVRKMGPIPWRIATRWGIEIARALHYAHRRKIVHRDVKPGNLLLDGEGRIRILDFGLAAALDSSGIRLTGSRATLGTPHFMPPEQIGDAGRVDHRADLYALGATLYYLLAAEVPFPGLARLADVFRHILEVEPPPLGPELPAALDGIVQRAMAKNPEERFASAREMGDSLAALLGP